MSGESNEQLKVIADMCRSGKNLIVKQAIERMRGHHDTERRVEYFRGEKLVATLLGTEKKKKQPYVAKDVEEATAMCQALLREGFFHRATRTGRGQLEFSETQKWDSTAYFVWDYEGHKGLSHLLTGLLIVGMLVATCFPIWPHFLKVYMWYCSVTLLIFMMVFIFFRAVIFLTLWIIGYDFWIFPNLFDESLSVIDSFKPAYSFEIGAKGQRYYRAALLLGIISFFIYCYNQPTDFDAFVLAQKEFVADLYDGKLLTDTSQQAKDDIDKLQRPSFEELAMEEENEAKERAARDELEKMHREAAAAAAAASGDDDELEEDDEEAEALAQDMMDRMLNDEED